MATNFKIGSFNAIDTSEENENKSSKSSKGGQNPDLKKKLIFLGGVILGVVVVLFLVLYLVSLFIGKNYSYDDLETIMIQAAENYFEDHPKKLPQNENQRVEIDVETLAASEYMDPMVEYTGEESTCTGKVSVQMNGDNYMYVPHLDCGDDYVTQSLSEVVEKDIVTEGYGLYQMGDSYSYRGENVDNYLELDNRVWRIVKITSNGQIMLILANDDTQSGPWDNRYNSQVGYNIGINSYSASRVKDSLLELYENNEEDETILSDNDRSHLVSFGLCVGKRSLTDTTTDNSTECSEVLEDQKIGLLTASDYMLASIDTNCTTITNDACQNYNYLVSSSYDWWLVTGVADTTDSVFGVSSNGTVNESNASSYKRPRAVVMLDENTLFKSGKGTLEKPYKIK